MFRKALALAAAAALLATSAFAQAPTSNPSSFGVGAGLTTTPGVQNASPISAGKTLYPQVWTFSYSSAHTVTASEIGGLILLFLVFEPHGLAEVWRRVRRFFHLWPFRA